MYGAGGGVRKGDDAEGVGVGMKGEDSAAGGVNGVPPGPGIAAGGGGGGGGLGSGENDGSGGLGGSGISLIAASFADCTTEENISPADEGDKGKEVGAKLEEGVGSAGLGGSIVGGSGGFGGACGSLDAVGDERKGDDLNGSAGGAGGVAGLEVELTGEKVPEVVGAAVAELEGDTGVIVGAGGAGISSSSSTSVSSLSAFEKEGTSPVVSSAERALTKADSSSAISSSSSSSSSNASASSSLIPTEGAGAGGGAGGAGGGGALGSPIMLRRSGAPSGVDKPEPGVEKELEEGPTSKVDSFGVAGAPIIDVLWGGGGGGGGGVNSTGGPAEKSGPIEISCGGAAFGSGANSRCMGCHGEDGSPCSSCLRVMEMSNCLNSSICLEISMKRRSVKLRKPIKASLRTSGFPGGGGRPMSFGVTRPSASSCGRI